MKTLNLDNNLFSNLKMLGEIKSLKYLTIISNKIETLFCNYQSESINGLHGVNVYY